MSTQKPLDPWKLLGALERHRVSYVLVGELAAVIHGAGGVADHVEISPSLKPDNLARLRAALGELAEHEVRLDAEALAAGNATSVETPLGSVAITPEPPGSRGYDDLRRAATREPIGSGVRPNVASLGDLIRIADASNDPALEARAQTLRRLAELGVELGIELA
jgi:hypothetical protein